MADVQMVVVGGIRYRLEDAKRLGLVADTPPDEKSAPAPKNKARSAKNKAREDS